MRELDNEDERFAMKNQWPMVLQLQQHGGDLNCYQYDAGLFANRNELDSALEKKKKDGSPSLGRLCPGSGNLSLASSDRLVLACALLQLLSGGNHDIDIGDLRKNTRYTGGYTERSRTVKLFWEVFVNFEPKEWCLLLKFVTSCSRAPLLGFKYLQPNFTIHKVLCDLPLLATFGRQDVVRLPSASTCYNTLKLPTYKRQSTLRAKLLYAINSNAGFELS